MNLLQAHGKLLISAEYMVMHGALALALPLKKGQSLKRVKADAGALFSWKAFHGEDPWFSASFDPSSLEIAATTDREKAETLQRLLRACTVMNPAFQEELQQWQVETSLDFSPSWGFGSSSTLTALLAQWAGIDPLDLGFRVSDGSGYDVACATARQAILYRLGEEGPHVEPAPFHPPFASRLCFVWLGSKQSTARHLKEMSDRFSPGPEDIRHFSRLTRAMLETRELSEFQRLMEEHETTLSALIGREKVKDTRFPGLQGSVKSLGAWGGDFVMIASDQDPDRLSDYLDTLGLSTRFSYRDIILGT
jgi:mevalonate kinase